MSHVNSSMRCFLVMCSSSGYFLSGCFNGYFLRGYFFRSHRLLVISLLLLAPLAFGSEEGISTCAKDKVGPIATLALLSKKEGVSDNDFYSYWRDIHGMLATRIPGFWTYRQYHIDKEVVVLRRLPIGYKKAIEPLDGFADVSFCNQNAVAGLAGSPQAELIKHDEKNVFASSYLYAAVPGDSITLKRQAPLAEIAAIDSGDSLIMLLAKGEGESAEYFKQTLQADLYKISASCLGLQRLRVNYFQPYDASAWPAPGVNHQPLQIMDAAVEFQFADRKAALDCLTVYPQAITSGSGNAATRLQLVYSVNKRYAMVVGGRISLIGLRGLPAVELIRRLSAENQRSAAVLKVVYGDSAQ